MITRCHGFSLIEALVALLLVLLGLTGAARLQTSLIIASAEAKARDEATAFALDQLSVFQAITRYAEYRDMIISGSRECQGLLHAYRIEWNVADNVDPDYKRVDVVVHWPAGNPTHSLQIQTLIPGLEPARFARQQLQP